MSSYYEMSRRQYGKSRMALEYAKLMANSEVLTDMKYYLTKTQYKYFLGELGQDFVDEHCVLVEDLV